MALEDPNNPLGDRRKVEREVGGTMRWGWIWILIAIIIILVIWFGGYGWGTSGGWWASRSRPRLAPAPNENAQQNPTPLTQGQQANSAALGGDGVQILTSTNKSALVGQPFDIRNVPVEEKDGQRALWIGANNIQPMLVVLVGNNAANADAAIAQGSRIDVTGTVERAPSAQIAQKQWQLSADGAKRLEQEGAYVQATIARPAQP